jgi:ribonuclease HII
MLVPSIPKPTFDEENALWQRGFKYIAGIDEVGRGCFAGPVVSAAVILPSDFGSFTTDIHDSKLLSPNKREELAEIITKHSLAHSIAVVNVNTINKYGIGMATQKSFNKAVRLLSIKPDFILIDAFYIKGLNIAIQKPIIHGDRKSISIAAASIIAKVYRDKLMGKLGHKYSPYDFKTNKGYGTKLHREAIKVNGLSKLHRTSFKLEKYVI